MKAVEKTLAEAAGLGWQGKHSNLVSREHGSWLLLGAIYTTAELESDAAGRDRCGSCDACQLACPTDAFPAPYRVDARRCISYLTIEHRGSIPEDLRPLMKNWIYGCDECQTVCPWVKQFAKPGRTRFLSADPEVAAPELTGLLALDEDAFRASFRGTPVLRTKRRGLLRNVCVALGNSGEPAVIPALERACADPEPLIREHAEWALDQLR